MHATPSDVDADPDADAPLAPSPPLDSNPSAVYIMPKPAAPSVERPNKKRRVEPVPPPASAPPPVRTSPPPSPLPTRRRAPALERLPRWLFASVRCFAASHGKLPLPQRVAKHGTPFYDWDAWALALLRNDLWCRRGPWERLIASCTAAKPPHIGHKQVEEVKCALVRIVVAEVVSQLVCRNGEQLTPEDRNWITSVASRQRGRDSRKPTLMLLFDLAFVMFDLVSFCRCNANPVPQKLNPPSVANSQDALEISQSVLQIVSDALRMQANHADGWAENGFEAKATETFSQPPNRERDSITCDHVVMRILGLVNAQDTKLTAETSFIDNIRCVIDSVESVLQLCNANRWYQCYTSDLDSSNQSFMLAARAFCRRCPLNSIPTFDPSASEPQIADWLYYTLCGAMWRYWAELANHSNFVLLTGHVSDDQARETLCYSIVKCLLTGSNVDEKITTRIMTEQAQYDEGKLTVRRLLDMAIGLEQFYTFFVESHGSDNVVGSAVTWGVLCFEGLIQLLGRLRDVLCAVPNLPRELGMAKWSARALAISRYYRDAVLGEQILRDDINRAIQIAFSEASWSPQPRAFRYMVQPPPHMLSDRAETEAAVIPQFWLATVDLMDPVYLAAAIVPWDPHRALKLLDSAIGLSETIMADIRNGTTGLPLLDFRRITVCRIMLVRGNARNAVLVMERLQSLFDQVGMHEGGNFSEATIPLLEMASTQGNFCAQTTHGLILAGEDEYWNVARTVAKCRKSTKQGIEKLYLSATAGDLEACTALTHLWAQSGTGHEEVLNALVKEQVYNLFKVAVSSQNASAVLNLGVIWKYGLSDLVADRTIAVDAFLIALQGAIFPEARTFAAIHLSDILGKKETKLSRLLKGLMLNDYSDCVSACSPFRIDDFRGGSQ